MGVLFISHSRHDDKAAIRLRDWLKARGWNDVFLDLDPEHGMTAGSVWQQELKHAGERCSAVLVLLSPSWISSPWCQTEFLVADQLGKKIFPILVAAMSFDDLPAELKARFQMVDISLPEKEAGGFERLAIGLKRAGLDPTSFEWPPPSDPRRPIYRGLQALDERDAAIFFGRNAQITEGLDALRRMRDGSTKRTLVILGSSGAGKSSFLRAGLIARLQRDEENFLVLPVIRPERALLSGEHGIGASLSHDPDQLKTPQDIQKVFDDLRVRVTDRLRRYAERAHESYITSPPTIVIPIDQAEELFAAANTEAPGSLDMLVPAVLADANAVIVATIRSDSFPRMQEAPAFADIGILPFSLAAMPHGSFKDVIEGPARLAHPPLIIEAALTERLLRDLATNDALPLLAFTLERLLYRSRGQRGLTLAQYDNEMGGLQGAILAAVEEAFAKAQRDPSLPSDRLRLEQLARAAFIPGLVQVDDAESDPKRRVESLDELPERTRPLIRHLVDARLLISDCRVIDGIGSDTVEVAHEAILRQWPSLRSWISEEREALRTLDGVRTAARDWQAHRSTADQGRSWLVHGNGRLAEAEQLLAPAHFVNALRPFERDYLAACRARDNAERERERNEIERERRAIVRTRGLQRNIFVLIGAAVVIVFVASFGIVELLKGIATRSSGAFSNLAQQASANQDYERAARYALVGLTGADWPVIGYPAAEAERQLRGAIVLSQRIAVLRGHEGVVRKIAYSPDGTRVVTASDDKTARIWDARTGKQMLVLRGHKSVVHKAAFSPDGERIVTASDDDTARIWDARTGVQIAILRGHQGAVYSAAWSPDGTRILTASDDRTARIWDVHAAVQIAILRGHEGGVYNATWSPDATRIATASTDKTARIWDVHTLAQIAVLRGHDGVVYSAAWSPDGGRIVTASSDNTARLWDSREGNQISILRGHEGFVESAEYSRDGKRIVTASEDRTARLWDANTTEQIAVLRGHEGVVDCAAWSPDGARIATASLDSTSRIWDARTGLQIFVMRGREGVSGASWSPDGTRIAGALIDKTAQVWDARTAAQIVTLHGHEAAIFGVDWSPDSTRIVTASQDKTARVWDARTAAQTAVLRGHDSIVVTAAWSPDGSRIATSSVDKTVRIWNARTGKQISILRGHAATVEGVAYSADGSRVVSASDDKTARIWDTRTGKQIGVLRGHDGIVLSAAFSPDDSRVVTASVDGTARIWDVRTDAQIGVLHGHTGMVGYAAWSPDGSHIVTASFDRTARVWDALTGAQVAVLRGHDGAVSTAEYSPDGAHIITASLDDTARIWKVPRIVSPALTLSRSALISFACRTLLSGGLDHFSNEELAAAPDLDPKLDANACHPTTLFERLSNLLFAADAR